MTTAIHVFLAVSSCGGLTFLEVLRRSARPHHLRRLIVPEVLDVPLTLDTDWQGLVL